MMIYVVFLKCRMRLSFVKSLMFLLIALLFGGCVYDGTDDEMDYLPIDDSQYPYAGIPRVVIETEFFSDPGC